MFRRYPLLLGFLLATAFWLVVLALASNTSLGGYVKAIVGVDANTIIAFASAASAAFALALFVNAHHQLTHNQEVERAYVKISHPSPGIRQLNSDGSIRLTVSIKNYGPVRALPISRYLEMPRETVRRHMGRLVALGLFEREKDQTFVPTKELREVEIDRALRLLRQGTAGLL